MQDDGCLLHSRCERIEFESFPPVIWAKKKKERMQKQIPIFENEDEEREFWATHDSTDYLDWGNAERAVFPKLKSTTRTISLRMSESMLNELKLLANKMDVPYQSLIKVYLRERIDRDLHGQLVET